MKFLSIIVCFVMLTVSNLQSKDYHTKETDVKFRWVDVVFHIAIPDTVNNPGKSLWLVLFEYLGNDTVISSVPNLEADENDSLQAGYIYEHFERFNFSRAALSHLERQQELDARFTFLSNFEPVNLMKKLKFWGWERNLP